ncbi:Ribonuclease H-like domain [Rhynchospora pubera]|uniref:Ribonuclease H-like domain n=1 Tax=Rhynchospora pubera TaxID=906938 RepID=A0AAV8G249_9POAL|nr:Ribonuclease H-like domain [Rhynchospora pubera]
MNPKMHPKKEKRIKDSRHRKLAMADREEKKKAPVELTIKRDKPLSDTHYELNPLMVVHVGTHLIETTVALADSAAGAWVRSTISELKLFRRRGPVVVGLCAFRGYPAGSRWNLRGPLSNPNHPSNPYRAIAICLGGSHVLFYELDTWYRKDPGSIIPRGLRDLLDNRKVVVVGWGIKEMVNKLQYEWGLKVARPVDVRKVAAGTYGKDAVWWPKHEKGRVVMGGLGFEELAELALDGMQLEKKPAKVREANWGEIGIDGYYGNDDKEDLELIKYATRDAFVTHQIATKCIGKSGLPRE